MRIYVDEDVNRNPGKGRIQTFHVLYPASRIVFERLSPVSVSVYKQVNNKWFSLPDLTVLQNSEGCQQQVNYCFASEMICSAITYVCYVWASAYFWSSVMPKILQIPACLGWYAIITMPVFWLDAMVTITAMISPYYVCARQNKNTRQDIKSCNTQEVSAHRAVIPEI